MPVIELSSIHKAYGMTEVLGDVTLCVDDGESLVLVGPSGCGKSTLLGLILGLVPPDRGDIRVKGQLLSAWDLQKLRQSVGFVIQSGGLFPHLTAYENITLMALHIGWPREKARARAEDLAGQVRLDVELFDRYPGQMSGGQKQRVALARALMLDPDILLLDEPFGALDTLVRHDLQDELKALFTDLGKTVVMVTHDMAEAAFFADRVALLNAGRIEQIGPPADLVQAPASPFVRTFLTARRDLADQINDRRAP